MLLRQAVERRHRRPVEQPEGARVVLNRKICQPPEQRVKGLEARASQSALLPRTAHGEHHLRAAAPSVHELWDELGRILHVGIHRDRRVGIGRVGEAGGQGALVAKVARQLNHPRAGYGGRARREQRATAVAAAVIGENGDPLLVGPGRKHRIEPAEQLGQHCLLVEHGDDDGDAGAGGGHGLKLLQCGALRPGGKPGFLASPATSRCVATATPVKSRRIVQP